MDPIQLDTNHQFNSISDSTLEQAQLNAQFAYEAQIADWNRARAAEYEAAWKVYVAARDARPDSPSNVPAPVPARAEAVYRDSRGWPYVDTSDKPVIAPHTYVPAVKTQGGFFTAGTSPAQSIAMPIPDVKVGEIFAVLDRRYVRIA